MLRHSLVAPAAAGLAALFLGGAAHGFFDINENVEIEPGSETGGHSSVNGSIDVGSDAVVNGDLETVNGSIRVDRNARIEDAQTVNGRIRLGSGVTAGEVQSVNGSILVEQGATLEDISVVNGRIELQPGARAAQDIGNVNGEILVEGAEIGGDLTTVNGDVSLMDGSHLAGDLTVEEPDGFGLDRRTPRIVIGPDARVDGDIVLEREVELYISETAEVGGVRGVMTLSDAVRFSGDHP